MNRKWISKAAMAALYPGKPAVIDDNVTAPGAMSLTEAQQTLGLPKHLRTNVAYNRQAYVDEPRFRYIHPTPIANAVRFAHTGKQIRPIQIFIGVERVRLRWDGAR